MRKILTYIFALSCVLGLTACNNSTKPEPQKEIQSQSDTSQNTLVVYFSMPETTNSENMTEEEDNSTVVIDGEVMGNTQYVAMEIQEKMNADIFRIEPETSYTTNHVVNIPAEVKHWHGATKNSWFSHIAISVPCENGYCEWLEEVEKENK